MVPMIPMLIPKIPCIDRGDYKARYCDAVQVQMTPVRMSLDDVLNRKSSPKI